MSHWTTLGTLSLLLLLGFILLPTSAFAKDAVACRYLQSQGQNIQLEVSVQSPPPASLIVIQRLPAGIAITEASPPTKKYNEKSGEAKWLFKSVKPGTFVIGMTLDKPIGAGTIRGEIRYMDPVTGEMIRMPVIP